MAQPSRELTPYRALKRIGFLLDRRLEPSYRVKAFHGAAAAIADIPEDELRAMAASGGLKKLKGVGDVTSAVIIEALSGQVPGYLAKLEEESTWPPPEGAAILAALRGDCHVHSDWSDGGAPIREMAETAIELGHEYMVLTDHSPRLTVAHGLNRDRLLDQIAVIERLNDELAPFRILTGMEVDILEDGALDMDEDLLERLDIVVASVHSKLKMPADEMTRRMVLAMASPHTDILGHLTGRKVSAAGEGDRAHRGGRTRPPSTFDVEKVLAACVEHDKAVEINCRPDRLDPPKRLLRVALEAGCRFSIDTDAHAPGQLDWLGYGVQRAVACGVPADRVVNTLPAAALLDWAGGHG